MCVIIMSSIGGLTLSTWDPSDCFYQLFMSSDFALIHRCITSFLILRILVILLYSISIFVWNIFFYRVIMFIYQLLLWNIFPLILVTCIYLLFITCLNLWYLFNFLNLIAFQLWFFFRSVFCCNQAPISFNCFSFFFSKLYLRNLQKQNVRIS